MKEVLGEKGDFLRKQTIRGKTFKWQTTTFFVEGEIEMEDSS